MDAIRAKKKKKGSQLYFNATWHQGAEGIWPKKNVKQTGQKEGTDAERSDRLQQEKGEKTPQKCVKTTGRGKSESSSQVEV